MKINNKNNNIISDYKKVLIYPIGFSSATRFKISHSNRIN